jgi:copper ion binding protein
MTNKWLILLVLFNMFFIGCSGNNSQTNQTDFNVGAEKFIEIPIEGMSCMSCAASVKKTLSAIDGVKNVTVSLEDKNARIKYDTQKVSPKELAEAINKLGYMAGEPKELTE